MDKPTIEAMAARLERLERQCRLWRRAALVAVIGSAAVLSVGGAKLAQAPNEFREFLVVDDAGNPRIRLAVDKFKCPRMEFLSEAGWARLELGIRPGDPANPKELLEGKFGTGTPFLEFVDSEHHPRIRMGMYPTRDRREWPFLNLTDENIESKILTGVDQVTGEGYFEVRGRDNSVILSTSRVK